MIEPYELVARFKTIERHLQPLIPGHVIRVSMSNDDFENAPDVFTAPVMVTIYDYTDANPVPRCIASKRIEQNGDIKLLIKECRTNQ